MAPMGNAGSRLRRWPAVVAATVGLALAVACGADEDTTPDPADHPGATVYAANCAQCHGASGEGGIGPAIGDGAAADALTADEMIALVTDGRDAMPAFGEDLTQDEIRQVVEYVRELLGRATDDSGDGGDGGSDDGSTERGSLEGTTPEYLESLETGDWAVPNGDLSSQRARLDSAITSETVADLELAWAYDVPGSGEFGNLTTTALVSGDSVYVGDLTTKVHAVDRETGEGRFVVGEEASIFGPTGVALGWGRLYGTTAGDTGSGTVAVAYDAETGDELWQTPLAEGGSHIDMQPIAHGGLVLYSTSGYGRGTSATITALDAETGAVVWEFDVIEDPDIWGNPDLNSGGGVWYPATIDPARGIAYFGTGNPYPFPGADGFPNGSSRPGDNRWTVSIIALDIETGELVWGEQHVPHDLFDRDAMITARVDVEVEGEERALAISTGKLGVLFGLDADTGEQLWRTEVGIHDNDDLTEIDGETLVYPGSLGGVQTPIAIADGTIFTCVVNAPSLYSGPEETSYGFNVQLGSANSELVAVDAVTGEIDWTVELEGDAFGGATVAGDLVFTSTWSGIVLALDRETGDEVWRYEADGGINGWITVTADELYIPVGIGDPAQLLKFELPED